MSNKPTSPYLSDTNRLADVISAIQAMGTYKFYKMDFKGWADRISADESKAEYWKRVFEQHPEFFRLDAKREKASLVWRRQYPRRFHVDRHIELTEEQYDALPEDIRATRISRTTLNSNNIEAMIKVAIDLHSRALHLKQDRRWWIPLISGVSALLGAIIGALLKS